LGVGLVTKERKVVVCELTMLREEEEVREMREVATETLRTEEERARNAILISGTEVLFSLI